MPDYAGNSKKSKDTEKSTSLGDTPSKNVEKVVVADVIIQKKGIGRKFKDLFIEADFKTVVRFIAMDVLVPAAKNMLLDASNKGVERMLYGESAIRRRGFGAGPRITYNTPVNRGYSDSPLRSSSQFAPQPSREPRTVRYSRNEFVLTSKEDAELVLERMVDIIDNYDVVSVADLNELIGQPSSHTDNKYGWSNLAGVQIRQIREGYLIDFPLAEPIQ